MWGCSESEGCRKYRLVNHTATVQVKNRSAAAWRLQFIHKRHIITIIIWFRCNADVRKTILKVRVKMSQWRKYEFTLKV